MPKVTEKSVSDQQSEPRKSGRKIKQPAKMADYDTEENTNKVGHTFGSQSSSNRAGHKRTFF